MYPNRFQSREYIPYQENVAIRPTPKVSRGVRRCQHCHITLAEGNSTLMCDVCWIMLDAVASPYFTALQREWWIENDRRIARKAMLLDPNYGTANDDDTLDPQA